MNATEQPDRVFAAADQEAFATLSGDYNPIHLDAIAARRTIVGTPIVHGMHLVLWGLDRWIARRSPAPPLKLGRMRARFVKTVAVGEPARLRLTGSEKDSLLEVLRGDRVVAEISASWIDAAPAAEHLIDDVHPPHAAPKRWSPDELRGIEGVLSLSVDSGAFRRMFPAAAVGLPRDQAAVLLAASRLVGMECPGLNSVFSELELSAGATRTAAGLRFRVTRFDARFRALSIAIDAPGLGGSVEAFVRPEAQMQIAAEALSARVTKGIFDGQRALVVGGSRGLGEVIAKVLAAGGADVRLTYHRGKDDADRVIGDIRSAGGRAESFRLDVTEDGADAAVWSPTHLYYMATPLIAPGEPGHFRAEVFRGFCDHYVDGFARAVKRFATPELRGIFYPSSEYVDTPRPDMAEYVAAKAAGEALAVTLGKTLGVAIAYPRLPRMATDQTASLMPSLIRDPAEYLVALLSSVWSPA